MKAEFPILLLAICDPTKALALSGIIARLKQEVPHARITLVTTAASAELYQDDEHIDEIRPIEGAIFKIKAIGLLSELSRRSWGLCIDIGPTLVSRMMKAKTRFTLNPNDSVSPLIQIAEALHLDVTEVLPSLQVSSRREAQVRTFLDSGRGMEPLIVMAPGAQWLGRRWPTERFAVLASRLMKEGGPFEGHRLLVIGGEAERDTVMALTMATPRARVFELSGKLDLLTAYTALREAKAFLGNDEVWLHLAAAAGIPAFGLFGPSDEGDAPLGDNVSTIRGPRSLAEIQIVDPKLKQSVCHMLDLSIDKVYDLVSARMQSQTARCRQDFDASLGK